MMTTNQNRSGNNTAFNILTGALATLTFAATVLITEVHPAWAQHAIVTGRADGASGDIKAGHMFVMPAMPARFNMLIRPEFTRRDVPLLHDQLNLDEEQMYVAEVLVDGYAEQFKEALDKFTEVRKHYRLKFPGMEDGDLAALPPPDMLGMFDGMNVDESDDGDAMTISFGDFEFTGDGPGTIQIGVTQNVSVDTDVNVGADGKPTDDGVKVAFVATDENGENLLTDEQQKIIEAKISAALKERLAVIEAKLADVEARRAAAEANKDANPADAAEEAPPATAEDVAKAARELLATRQRLHDEFIGDINGILSDEQHVKMPAFERTHRRINTMRYAELAGERVDLLRILKQQQPKAADQGALNATKSTYETDLDTALKARNDMIPENEIDMLLAMDAMISSGEMKQDEKQLALMDTMANARVAVRDTNLNAADAIEPLLAEEDRAAFHDAVRTEAFPMVYGGNSTQRSLKAALKFEDLNDETRKAIEALNTDYTTQSAALNDRIAEQMRKDEPRQHRQMAETFDKMREAEEAAEAGGPQADFSVLKDNPTEKLRRESRELNKRTMVQLKGMLTEEQITQLPKRKSMPFFQMNDDGPNRGVNVIKIDKAPPPPPGD